MASTLFLALDRQDPVCDLMIKQNGPSGYLEIDLQVAILINPAILNVLMT